MPAVSEAQRRYLNARFGHAWVVRHGFDNKGKLPKHVHKKGKRGRRYPNLAKNLAHAKKKSLGQIAEQRAIDRLRRQTLGANPRNSIIRSLNR